MKVSKSGEYLKADAVKSGSVIKILDEGAIEVSDKYKYPDGMPQKMLVFTVEYSGERKKLRINAASKAALIDAFGDDTVGWVNKQCSLIVIPAPNGQNKMIILQPLTAEPKQKTADVDWA